MSTLQQVVDRVGPLEVVRITHYVFDIIAELRQLHARGTPHGEVCPASAMLDEMGKVRLTSPVGIENIDTARVRNVVSCLAPEQALAASSVDCRADIYSLGCRMYFLLTGRHAFNCDGMISECLLKHQVESPTAVLAIRPDTPAEIVALCNRMMAKAVVDRPQTVVEVSDVLESWADTR